MSVKIERNLKRAVKIALLSMAFFTIGGVAATSESVEADEAPAIYNGNNPNTKTVESKGLTQKVWLSATDSNTNEDVSSNYGTLLKDGHYTSQNQPSIVNFASAKNLTLNLEFKNDGNSSVPFNEMLNLPLDNTNSFSTSQVVYSGEGSPKPITSSKTQDVKMQYNINNAGDSVTSVSKSEAEQLSRVSASGNCDC